MIALLIRSPRFRIIILNFQMRKVSKRKQYLQRTDNITVTFQKINRWFQCNSKIMDRWTARLIGLTLHRHLDIETLQNKLRLQRLTNRKSYRGRINWRIICKGLIKLAVPRDLIVLSVVSERVENKATSISQTISELVADKIALACCQESEELATNIEIA